MYILDSRKLYVSHPNCSSNPSPSDVGGYQGEFEVTVKKEGTTSLGINVIQKGGMIYIKSIVPDFPASACTELRIGDQILEVNGSSLEGKYNRYLLLKRILKSLSFYGILKKYVFVRWRHCIFLCNLNIFFPRVKK